MSECRKRECFSNIMIVYDYRSPVEAVYRIKSVLFHKKALEYIYMSATPSHLLYYVKYN